MLPITEAETLILQNIQPLNPNIDSQLVNLTEARGRVLATPITSALDFPHWDNSAMDGYAVRYLDVRESSADRPTLLEVIGEVPAGAPPQLILKSGQAARIFTGAIIPEGADTVIMQENTERRGDNVAILAASQSGEFVRKRGSFYRAGNPLLPAGTPINMAEIAILAAAQCTDIEVYRRPRVGIFATGNELVSPEQPLKPGQIVDSNQYALAAGVAQLGGIPHCFGIIPDDPESTEKAIAAALPMVDIMISSGGVSVGDYDYIDRILRNLGATLHVTKIAIKPGKPLTFATFPKTLNSGCLHYFGLPGNPVSALVCFYRFVQPALRKLAGYAPQWKPKMMLARTCCLLRSQGKRETYLWGQLNYSPQGTEFDLAPGLHNSANLINLAGTTGFAILPVGTTQINPGEGVRVMSIYS
ncbi:molybdopterin molybdotransferase MoeA [Roseofilum casamattae]|uniref:Molybdopterin molybdenumtransferase n=1 Tax=Roseofilum casamattae BLCC-M143 TaxID=3022442 RepID=A0ABT7BZV0_9CYAN|nr:gephyrin-like molybdotransferase Glp [Roseofilum casamattae]MDJ1184696.1 molybdopterin molybdotransferase MoeA [Roseofilum casamattae BLCC-M143]